MDYKSFMEQEIDVTDVLRVNDMGEMVTLKHGPKITVREFLAGLDLAYRKREQLDRAIESMEALRLTLV